jgi:excisionase family DNA binding protein
VPVRGAESENIAMQNALPDHVRQTIETIMQPFGGLAALTPAPTATPTATPTAAPTDRLLTAAECCKYLRLSRSQLWRLCTAGTLPSVKIGRRILFSEKTLQAFLSRHTVGALAPTPGKGKRGRPLGSRNKRALVQADTVAVTPAQAEG